MFEEMTQRKKPILEKLVSYGFEDQGNYFQYCIDVYKDTFLLIVKIDRDGIIKTDLIDKETQEPYILYKLHASGLYASEVRETVKEVINHIIEKCYEDAIFKTEQSQMVISFVREIYGDELEFLWTKFSDNAVWRRKDNGKWYGALLKVEGKKIGLKTNEIKEIIDLRMNPDDAELILSREHYYPGWHMNKKSWYTLVLDGSICDEELKKRIQESYNLAKK